MDARVCLTEGLSPNKRLLPFLLLLPWTDREPKVQERVREEIHEALGRNQQPTLADRQRLPFTEATVMEIQRMANVRK